VIAQCNSAQQTIVDLDRVDEPVLAAADGGMDTAQGQQLPEQRRDRRGLRRWRQRRDAMPSAEEPAHRRGGR